MPTLTKADLPDIIQRYLNGESIQALAKDAKVSRQAIYQWMHRTGDTHYYDLVTDAMLARLADADQDLEDATDMLDIARAREKAKFTRWDLERRRPGLFGPKQEIKQETSLTITVIRQPVASERQVEDAVQCAETVLLPSTNEQMTYCPLSDGTGMNRSMHINEQPVQA